MKSALCDCGNPVPWDGPGSQLRMCLPCRRLRRNRQLVIANRVYRTNHGTTSPQAGRLVNPIGMVVRPVTNPRPQNGRAKNPRYRPA